MQGWLRMWQTFAHWMCRWQVPEASEPQRHEVKQYISSALIAIYPPDLGRRSTQQHQHVAASRARPDAQHGRALHADLPAVLPALDSSVSMPRWLSGDLRAAIAPCVTSRKGLLARLRMSVSSRVLRQPSPTRSLAKVTSRALVPSHRTPRTLSLCAPWTGHFVSGWLAGVVSITTARCTKSTVAPD